MKDKELTEKIRATLQEHAALKRSSINSYARILRVFAKRVDIDLFNLPDLATLEQKTESFILANRSKLAPMYLNALFSAVKTWCYCMGLIKNRNQFKEIKFDKSSRKTDAMTERPLETQHMKKLFRIADPYEQVLLGLYGLAAMRPALLSQLMVGDFHPDDYIIEDRKIRLTAKNPILFVLKSYEGNKANSTFFVIIPSRIAEAIEYTLNTSGNVTKDTKIMQKYPSKSGIYEKVEDLFKKVGFHGRAYLLRSFGDRLLDKTINDKDLKEFMMGHKGSISARYQFKQLSNEDKEHYLNDYAATELFINTQIFGLASREDLTLAQKLAIFAQSNGVDQETLSKMVELLKTGKMSLEDYEKQLGDETKKALETKMKKQFESMFLEMNEKVNGKKKHR